METTCDITVRRRKYRVTEGVSERWGVSGHLQFDSTLLSEVAVRWRFFISYTTYLSGTRALTSYRITGAFARALCTGPNVFSSGHRY